MFCFCFPLPLLLLLFLDLLLDAWKPLNYMYSFRFSGQILLTELPTTGTNHPRFSFFGAIVIVPDIERSTKVWVEEGFV